jgi:hypothetical protein
MGEVQLEPFEPTPVQQLGIGGIKLLTRLERGHRAARQKRCRDGGSCAGADQLGGQLQALSLQMRQQTRLPTAAVAATCKSQGLQLLKFQGEHGHLLNK